MKRKSLKNEQYFYDMNIAKILNSPITDWSHIVRKSLGNKRFAKRSMKVDWKKYTIENYLFAHTTIVASVETEKDGFTIKDPCYELVNANGNSWTNEVLKGCFRTFIGKPVFEEHVEIPGLSKGIILDAVLRPVEYVGSNGKTANVYYCDLMTATDRRHKMLVNDIETGKLSTQSMGVRLNYATCSVCGAVIGNDDEECEHLKNDMGNWVFYKGKKKFCAELVGSVDKKGKYVKDSCDFFETSWVESPAFEGAVLNHFIETPEIRGARENLACLSEDPLDYLYHLRVADRRGKTMINVLIALLEEEKRKEQNNSIAKAIYKNLKEKI